MKCLNGPKWVPNELSVLKWSGYCLSDLNMPKNYPKRNGKLKSKSKLPRVTIKGLGDPLTRVSKVAQER